MNIDQLKDIDSTFTLVNASSADVELVGICHSDEPKDNTFCFLKNKKFLNRIGRRSNAQKFLNTGIVVEKKYFDSDPLLKENLSTRFGWIATVDNIAHAMCNFSKPFYDILYGELNYNVDGRQMGTTTIDPSAQIAQGVFIGENVIIGKNVKILPGCTIMPEVEILDETIIFPNVVVYPYTKIGKSCRVHSGTVIGADGFGYNFFNGSHNKIWHLCGVEISDHVEIGSNACIDAGAFNPTRIGRGSKLDNSVQISHNSIMGEHNIMCGKSGLAGSAEMGNYCVLAAYAGPAPGAILGDRVQVGAFGVVSENAIIEDGAVLAGNPARPLKEWLRSQVELKKLIKK